MTNARILVIDDEPTILEICQATLEQFGHRVRTCPTGTLGLDAIRQATFDLVLIDLRMHDIEGLSLLREIRTIDSSMMAILITGQPTIESAVQAVKGGAFDYLPKPFSADQLMISVDRALQQKQLVEENRLLRESLRSHQRYEGIVARSRAMERVLELVSKVANSGSSVVVEGETGTGKELVARSLHTGGDRRTGPFLPINCGALPEQLLESELFGHERGAFTGADSRKLGLLETAQGGTVFLDEVSSLSPGLQVKLLRVLQERELRRVGGQELISINIRVISATNERLEKLVEEGRFRSDLYYRLNVITITLPPLRDRPEDIPLLAEHFLAALNRENKGDVAHVSAEAMDLLQRYSWPGNVREMQNAIERAYWLTDSKVIVPADLPARLREATLSTIGLDADLPFADAKKGVLEQFEREYLSRMLGECDGNVSKAARRAGMHRSSFQRLLKRHEIRFK